MHALVHVVGEHGLQFGVQEFAEHENLHHICTFIKTLHEFARFIDLVDRLLTLISGHVQSHLLGGEDALQLFQKLLLALLQHGAIKLEGLIHFRLGFVILDLQSAVGVLHVLQGIPDVGGFYFGLRDRVVNGFDLLRDSVANQLTLVKAGGVLQAETLLANGHGTSSAKVLDQLAFVFGADQAFLAVVGHVASNGYKPVSGLVLGLVQTLKTMALKTVHELMRHEAMGAEEVDAIDAARNGVELLIFAAGAARRGRLERLYLVGTK